MGISPGWRDVYGASVAFQWVDVSDVKPGTYWIASSSDPDNVIVESNESNNGVVFAGDPSIIPGYVAQPLNVSAIVAGQPRSVTLTAQAYGSGGERRFRIVTSPSQGTLNKPVGQVFDGPDVVYSPSASFSGSDSFTYEALDANSEFPRTPTRATVTLTGSSGLPTVSISGAPASMVAGTSVQLRAAVTGAPQTVEWSVNNVVGGAAATGTITPGGLYTAPMTPPANGSVIVRAASTNARAEVTIGITAQPVPVPAPAPPPAPAPTPSPSPSPAPAPPPTPPAPTSPPAAVSTPATVVTPATDSAAPTAALLPPRPIAKRKLAVLARPSLARRGSLLVIGTTSRKAGTVEVTAWKGSSRLGRCLARTPAARSLTCQIRVRSSLQVAGIRIAVRLLVKGKPVALRRATFTRQIAGPRTLALYRGSGLECWLPSPTR
jgi:outer membrane biosynthesis protein TonB